MSVKLKIKSKHLSEEARIIRFEEYKLKRRFKYVRDNQGHREAKKVMDIYRSISKHRKQDVRRENRATFLARAYIAGKPYIKVEQKRHDETIYQAYILPRITYMVSKYGPRLIPKEVWDHTFRTKTLNPEYVALEQSIKEWSNV